MEALLNHSVTVTANFTTGLIMYQLFAEAGKPKVHNSIFMKVKNASV